MINSGNGIICKLASTRKTTHIKITFLNFFKPKKSTFLFKKIQPSSSIKIEICKILQAQGLFDPKGKGAQNNIPKRRKNNMEWSEYFKAKMQLGLLKFLMILTVCSTKRPEYSNDVNKPRYEEPH